jgi:cytochrome P450
MAAAHYDINLYDAAVVADPYPILEEIRAAGRVVRNDTMGLWMITGYDDCMKALTNPDDFGVMVTQEVTPWFRGNNMLMVDGDEHTRLRKCLAPHFTRQATGLWDERVYDAVAKILGPVLQQDTFDIITDFTMIPIVVIADMMGIPADRYEDLRRWSHTVVSSLAYGAESPETLQRLIDIGLEAEEYLAGVIDQHRRDRPDDVITTMLDSDMTESEIASTALMLVFAGYDTTAKLLSNVVAVLGQHPDQRQLLVDDPTLIPQAIEEVMRWAGVVHVDPRFAMRDMEFAGAELKAHDVVYLMLGAAGRDGARWNDPATFDVRRDQKSHLGFGYGSHLCLGMPLARLEAKASIERLLQDAPNYTTRGVDYGAGFNVRGPERGVVHVGRE